MKNKDFDEQQVNQLIDFVKAGKKCIKENKISPSFLLYLISVLPDNNKQDVYTKANKVLLRDTLPKKKRLHLDFLLKKFEKEV
jgi:hypothetical protein|tara:strand:- start:9 stop:257 length:249 start_codon:yes stop_codon:yes gene_type:complete